MSDYSMALVPDDKMTHAELAKVWRTRIQASDRIFQQWCNRFKCSVMYQYYEGFQHLIETDQNNLPYVVNLIYASIEEKLPNMLFDSPSYMLRPHPYGDSANGANMNETQTKEDTLNFIVGRREFGFNDQVELAVLDAFFGFGVIETDYSADKQWNASLNAKKKDPLNNFYCKQIPFDNFRVSSLANWNLTQGGWCGYFEFMTYDELAKYVKEGILIKPPDVDAEENDFAMLPSVNGKIVVSDSMEQMAPSGTVKVWKIWDFKTGRKILLCDDAVETDNQILEVKNFEDCPISTIRYGKRRKGWYPLPPVFQWLSPQDEVNDIAQASRIHRKRFSRKYIALEDTMNEEEMNKFLYGPDGTVVWVNKMENIKAVDDAPLDNANPMALQRSYDDFNRVSGSSNERLQADAPDRQTATAANLMNQSSQIRESKALNRVGEFLIDIGRNVLRACRKVSGNFWISQEVPEGLLAELKQQNTKWTKVNGGLFKEEDYDIDMAMASISPVYQAQDKQSFMQFVAFISQYEILSFSPALIREAAYRMGYKNSDVLNQFQQLAQLAALGKLAQAKQQTNPQPQPPQGVPGVQPPQAANAQALGPSLEQLHNMLFNGGQQQ